MLMKSRYRKCIVIGQEQRREEMEVEVPFPSTSPEYPPRETNSPSFQEEQHAKDPGSSSSYPNV